MKKILITGAAGFIGSSLANYINNPKKLMLVDDMSKGKIYNLNKNLRSKLIQAPIEKLSLGKFNKIDCIIHLAAQSVVKFSVDNFYQSTKKNLLSSLFVFEIAKKFKIPVIYASSCAVYGNNKWGNDKESKKNTNILSPYAQDKYTIEEYAKLVNDFFSIKSIGLRFFNVYGPNQKVSNPYSGVIPIFISKAKKNQLIKINGGYQTRDFIFVEDVIKILLLLRKKLIKLKNSRHIFNVCTQNILTINRLYTIIVKKIGSRSKKKYYKMSKNDPVKSAGSNKKICKFLGLNKGFFTKFEIGLGLTLKYQKK